LKFERKPKNDLKSTQKIKNQGKMSKTNVAHEEMPRYSEQDLAHNIILKLKNFKTYGNCEIRIPLNSTTLISGPSGIGKTSILEGFIYVMYDGVTKPEKFGTKNVAAWLFMHGTVIYRQKNPALLMLWKKTKENTGGAIKETVKEYTQNEAQLEINSIYGNYNEFLATSCLKQRELSPFLGSNDAEKLEIAKGIAFKGSESDEIKEPIKEEVKRLAEQYSIVKTQLDMSIGNIQAFDIRNPSIIQYQVPEKTEDIIKKVRELRIIMENLDKDYEVAVQREANAMVYKQQADQAKTKQELLLKSKTGIDYNLLQSKLAELENKLKEYAGMTFDSEKLAKVHIFKQWSNEKSVFESKLNALKTEYQKLIAQIIIHFPEIKDKSYNEVMDFSVVMKSKIENLDQSVRQVNMLLKQSGIQTIEEGRVQLESLEKQLKDAKVKETEIKADLEELKRRQEEEKEAARVKAEKELQEAQKRIEEERIKLRQEAEAEKEKLKQEADKIRLNNKMTCPTCKSLLIVGQDGKHLEKCEDSPSGIGVMLGLTTVPTEPPKTPKMITPPTPPPSVSKPIAPPVIPIVVSENRKAITVTPDDVITISNICWDLSGKIDRIRTAIDTCEKIKVVISDKKPEELIPLIPVLSKLIEYSSNLMASEKLYNDLLQRKPEEITEQVADSKDKDRVETEYNNTKTKVDQFNQLNKEIELEELKYKQFCQLMMEIMNQASTNSFEIKKQKSTLQLQIDQLMHLSSASDLLAQRSILENTMREKSSEAERVEKQYLLTQALYTKAVEAERIFLQTTIDKINILLGKFLQKLFPDNPISVEISTTKTLKSKKDQKSNRFDVKIFFKDTEYDNSKQLSGGEKDRVSLAITLAVNQIFGSPILFLDETLSSLDAESKSEAVSLLKEMCKNKTCIVISHEETEGLYDNVLRLRPN